MEKCVRSVSKSALHFLSLALVVKWRFYVRVAHPHRKPGGGSKYVHPAMGVVQKG